MLHIKYPTIFDDSDASLRFKPMSVRVPTKYHEMIKSLGRGNINAGMNILLFSIEEELAAHLSPSKRLQDSKKATKLRKSREAKR